MNDLSSCCVANGLRINLIQDPQATRSAALFRLSAGSFDEPARWPGLAHLLEHVLFAGSEGFQQEQRLMAWAPAQGARLNATTLAHYTAWFVEIAPEQLAAALCRLTDMLARPLLATEAIQAEAAAIEAEYRLLQSHGPTLCEAALSQAFAAPHPLHDFHVGSQHDFGDDAAALQQALRTYHQRFFHSGRLELWLSGPQPLAELRTLAEKAAAAFNQVNFVPDGFPLLQLARQRTFALQSAAAQQFQLSFVIRGHEPASLALLRELLADKAPGSLLATLREQGLCDDISLLEPYRSPQQSVVSVVFQRSDLQLAQCVGIENLFRRWLALLPELTTAQLTHYASLTQRRSRQLSVLDRLRELALGFPPAEAATALPVLQEFSRLWVSPAVNAPKVQAQGFTLKLAAIDWPHVTQQALPDMHFYSPSSAPAAPELPATRSALSHFAAAGEPVLMLSVQQPGRQTAAMLEAALQPAMGEAMHRDGELSFSRQHGLWLLRLSGSEALLAFLLDRALQDLADPSAATLAYGERLFHKAQQTDDIAIRTLLARLPDLLSGESPAAALRWRATLYGGSDESADTLARLLTKLPGVVEPTLPLPTLSPAQPHFFCPTSGQDAAVLVFCPLAERSAGCFANWQQLAAFFEPRFFQQLRVEANIGYVVSCRFHQAAGQAGLLFALQSPSLSAAELFRHIELFIAAMEKPVQEATAATLSASQSVIQQAMSVATPKNPEQITAHWLYQQLALSPGELQPAIASLRQAYRQLTDERMRRWYLSNSKEGCV
ncbi:pyrroloquinoline quinone biosynthesis protein PqqF [Kalamiella sp. sgz302252]|uniref:pyrroloquinoline quinone biosynthesis protein PqqF n=1 Tax=Pantoea sp. sgz302252 TaxID=3341827 RepID=UPI0036D40A72